MPGNTGGFQVDDETKKKMAEENADKGPQPSPDSENSGRHAENKEPKAKTPEASDGGATATNAQPPGYIPKYVDIGPKPKNLFKRIKWTHCLLRERRKLRKDLKQKGIKKYRDFDEIAREVGLGLSRTTILGWFWWKWLGLAQFFGLKGLFVAAGLTAAALFTLSYLTDFAGSFTINLTADMISNGFTLSENGDMSDPSSRLISDKVSVNNIALEDISLDVDDIDGPHNGKSYLAMTFYIQNKGENVNDVVYKLSMKESMLNVDKAVWLMLFMDGKQITYAQPNEEGNAEKLFGYTSEPPFYDKAYDPELQYYSREESGTKKWGITTTKFESENVVVQGVMLEVEPEETHKFTVVIWVEGWDPQCTNDIMGGFAKYEMGFDVIAPEEARRGIFDGVFRTEYEDYMSGKYQKEQKEKQESSEEKEPEGSEMILNGK